MKKSILLLFLFLCVSFSGFAQQQAINQLLDDWHKAAGQAKFDAYFSVMADDAIYIGTDATENWNLTQFKAFSKPYFDRGKAWNFIPLERHVYFSGDAKLCWFNELLDTQMKICRGSGVLRKENGQWKIVHYVLSMTIPNDNIDEVIKVKSGIEDTEIQKRKSKK